MALLWIDGFENYGTITGSAPSPTDVLGRKYTVRDEADIDITTGREGVGYGLHLNDDAAYIKTPGLTTNRTLIVGVAFKLASSTNSVTLLRLSNAYSASGMEVYFNGTGELQARRATTVLGTSSGLSLTHGVWYWLEFKVYCDNSAGTYEIQIGGVTAVSGSSVDTQYNNSVNYYDRVSLHPVNFNRSYFDDFYVCDSSGAANNDFLGNCKVETLRPDGADTTAWTPDSGTNYDRVNEQIQDADTSYVEASVSATKDLYTYGNTVNTTIMGVMITTDARQTDADDFTLKNVTKSDTTESDSSALGLGTESYISKTTVVEEDPHASAAWTQNTINAAKFGIKVG